MADKIGPRKTPCLTCPYRQDVPSGIWAANEYEKLPDYDGETAEQAVAGAIGLFYCHQRDGELCAGWVGCHDMRHNLAVRFSHRALDMDAVLDYESPVPLFSSGAEACAHGLRDIENPSDEAIEAAEKVSRIKAAKSLDWESPDDYEVDGP